MGRKLEPRNFSFLRRTPLWTEEEAEKQCIHNLIEHGEDIVKSLEWKIARREYIRHERWRQTSVTSIQLYFNPYHIRLRKMRSQGLDHTLRPYWEWLIKRLNYQCQMCNEIFSRNDLQVDHCVPLFVGGKNEWDNIQPLCRACNCKKYIKTFISDAVKVAQEEWKSRAA